MVFIIGVQGQGIGRLLIAHPLDEATRRGLPNRPTLPKLDLPRRHDPPHTSDHLVRSPLDVWDRMAYLFLIALLATGCAASPPRQPPGSGIEGRTMVDGGCPPARESPPCPDKPLSARIGITRAGSDTVVADVTGSEDGRFRVDLPPGDYTLHPKNLTDSALPAAQPVDTRVVADQYTTVTVSFDSGVRGAEPPAANN